MAIIKKSELKQIQKIEDRLAELRKELMKFNSQRAVKTTIENPGKIKELKRSIAKLLTIQNQQRTKEVQVKKYE